MRILKKIILIIFVLIALILASGWMYTIYLKPSYSGEIKLSNIENETQVYFDEFGIPHIYAENELDAITTLGYVHAQERLWQMELMKRIAPGRLSEIFGKDMLKNDQFFVNLGIEETSKKAIEKLDKNGQAYKQAMAYLNGINQFIEKGPTPIEFTIIGIEKEKLELIDTYNILGYMSFSFAMAQKTDPFLSIIQKKLGIDYLKALDIDVNPNSTLIKTTNQDLENFENLISNIDQILEKSPIPSFVGSNSWVVSPKKSSTGSVLFANDPHIEYSQPGTWYEAHISTPNYEMYGYYIAGVPFPLLGHNRNYAYGLTMFENDDMDFYKEENHPSNKNSYKTPQGYSTYEITSKTIKIKDDEDVTVEVKNTRHGPIVNNVIEEISDSNPIALFWAYTQLEGQVLNALHSISHATEMQDVKKGVSMIHAPGLNFMYGDVKGNIAWWAAAKLYKHKPHVNTKLILNGASGEDDIVEYLDFSKNPMAENPSWEYVYSANNQPDTTANMYYAGYYLPEDRAKRIVELLAPKNNWDKSSFETMINDATSTVALNNIKEFTSTIDNNSFSEKEKNAIEVLKHWDGSNNINDIAPTIYNKWIYLFLKNTFEDEMGEKLFNQFLKTTLMKRTIAVQLKKDTSIWWDNSITSKVIETKKDILSKSLIETVAALENQFGIEMTTWTWGKVHTLEHQHPLGTVNALRKYFNVGPFPLNGASEVINNTSYDFDKIEFGMYNITLGPSTRRIIDFSDIENSVSILPTGQSGNPFSIHYKDQAEMYNNGTFRKMKLNKEEIISSSTKLTILTNNE